MWSGTRQIDDGAPAKRIRYDDDGEKGPQAPKIWEESSLVDEAKGLLGKYGADGTDADEVPLSLMNLCDQAKTRFVNLEHLPRIAIKLLSRWTPFWMAKSSQLKAADFTCWKF